MTPVTLSPESLMKAIAIGQIAHIDEALERDAQAHYETSQRLRELERQIINNALERARLNNFINH